MTANDFVDKLIIKINGTDKTIRREGKKTFMTLKRGRKTISLHISEKITMKKRNGKIVDLPYKVDTVIQEVKKELNI
jgi:hypothetical protein